MQKEPLDSIIHNSIRSCVVVEKHRINEIGEVKNSKEDRIDKNGEEPEVQKQNQGNQ